MNKAVALLTGLFVALVAYYYDFHESHSISCLDAVYLPSKCSATNIEYLGLIAGLLVSLFIGRLVFKVGQKSFYIQATAVFGILFCLILLLNIWLERS